MQPNIEFTVPDKHTPCSAFRERRYKKPPLVARLIYPGPTVPPSTERERLTKKIRMSTRKNHRFTVCNIVTTVLLHTSQQGNADVPIPRISRRRLTPWVTRFEFFSYRASSRDRLRDSSHSSWVRQILCFRWLPEIGRFLQITRSSFVGASSFSLSAPATPYTFARQTNAPSV